jgi:hypothetical protein
MSKEQIHWINQRIISVSSTVKLKPIRPKAVLWYSLYRTFSKKIIPKLYIIPLRQIYSKYVIKLELCKRLAVISVQKPKDAIPFREGQLPALLSVRALLQKRIFAPSCTHLLIPWYWVVGSYSFNLLKRWPMWIWCRWSWACIRQHCWLRHWLGSLLKFASRFSRSNFLGRLKYLGFHNVWLLILIGLIVVALSHRLYLSIALELATIFTIWRRRILRSRLIRRGIMCFHLNWFQFINNNFVKVAVGL